MDQPAAQPPEVTNGWRRRDQAVAGIAALALVGSAYFAYAQYGESRDHRDLEDARAEVVDTASGIAVDLATISPKTAKRDIESLAARGTPEFAEQVRSNLDDQVDLIADNKVSSTGEVSEAGIVDLKGDKATVAVALLSRVKNSATDGKPEERSYRMNVSLERTGDRWLASEVAFVQ